MEKLSKLRNFESNSAGLRTALSSRLSHRELRSSLRESHSFLSLPADTTMASSHAQIVYIIFSVRFQQFIQQMNIA
jgi:hypothetical protein